MAPALLGSSTVTHQISHRTDAPARLVLALLMIVPPALLGCGHRHRDASAPQITTRVEPAPDPALVEVPHPERFNVVRVETRTLPNELHVNGVVAPDVTRTVHVTSLAGGKLLDLRAHLGDEVQRGQVLMVIHTPDLAKAIADYRKAVADQALADKALRRARELWEGHALAEKDLQQAENDAQKATVDVQTAMEQIKILGGDIHQLSPVIEIHAPIAGTIVEQNTTGGEAIKSLDNSPNLFTISDLTHVWILCDVYENDLPSVRVGDTAEIRLAAYPDRVLTGRIGNIGPILDPTIRSAKVRIEVANPGVMRVGMFVTAIFHGQTTEVHAVVPASAVLHLHDRDWVYVPLENGRFGRREVVSGRMLPGQQQELLSGVDPGERVVTNALVLQNTVEQ